MQRRVRCHDDSSHLPYATQSCLPSPSLPVIDGRFWTIAGHSLSIVLVAFLEALAIGPIYALTEGYPLHGTGSHCV